MTTHKPTNEQFLTSPTDDHLSISEQHEYRHPQYRPTKILF